MFCYQCEQSLSGTGCVKSGVCGKEADVAAEQDILLHLTKGIAQYAHLARKNSVHDPAVDDFTVKALFTTVTNVNFDTARMKTRIRAAVDQREKAKQLYEQSCRQQGRQPETLSGPATWVLPADESAWPAAAETIGITARQKSFGKDAAGVQELILYGLKGAAAYADHALVLGKTDEQVSAFFQEALAFLAAAPGELNALLAMALRVGEHNLRVMELLDGANTGAFGHPQPTPVRITPIKGKAILVSGHDLSDLEQLLKQTQGTGINVYTHGEMLPAHGYPGLKQYKHLAGNYGGAWQDQRQEFAEFPGAILMTTNCIQRPQASYQGRIFTSGLVAWPGVAHVNHQDFAPVIAAALQAPGFTEDGPDQTILVGFGHQAVLGVADKVVAAVKSGAIKHFYLIGGCDGAKSGRNIYTEAAQQASPDSVILTLACGKYRFNKFDFGTIAGIPRLLDIGQCNDAYSAIKIAGALAQAFNTDVNGLPLTFILSWYEQKAVAILLTLLHLGIRRMQLGPSLPAFVTPNVLQVLVDKFQLQPLAATASAALAKAV